MLGSGFVRALRRRGEDVQVWNRTHAKAHALEADGARAFADPADAARGAARIHLSLSDDAAVDDVLERARPGFAAGVRHRRSHDDVGHRRRGARRALDRARRHVRPRAGVHGAAERARVDRAHARLRRPRARRRAARRALAAMTGKLVDLGPRPDARRRVQAARQPVPDVPDHRPRRHARASRRRSACRRPTHRSSSICSTRAPRRRRGSEAHDRREVLRSPRGSCRWRARTRA